MVARLMMLVIVALGLCACESPNNAGAGATFGFSNVSPPGPPTDFTGVLHGGMMAIGGETTGWILREPGQTGGVQVDVSRVPQEAQRLEGQQVTIYGRIVAKQYVERGTTPILVAERIVPASGATATTRPAAAPATAPTPP